jgi:xyloglucan-specific exo-beta-1,4-glucanase
MTNWSSVNIQGMGFVTGLVQQPMEQDLKYVRTDVGGAFRWEKTLNQWVSITDYLIGDSVTNIESIAIDPQNKDVVYIATGNYIKDETVGKVDGEIWKSNDRGQTWTTLNLKKTDGSKVRLGANASWRGAGERLAVDPNNANIIYFGSRYDGLFRTINNGQTWEQVNTEKGTSGIGITFVAFDKNSTSNNQTQKIYLGIADKGVYVSNNSGQNWSFAGGGTSVPFRYDMFSDGTLYVTYAKWDGDPVGGSLWKAENGN